MQATDLSRRLPIGAERQPGGGRSLPAVWAPRAHRVAVASGGRRVRGRAGRRRPAATSAAWSRRAAAARATASASTAASACSRPGVALSARGPARPVAGRSTRPPSPGPTATGAASGREGQVHLRDARRHLHAARAPGRRRRGELPELARARHHRARGDAGRRVPRPLRLGLRRRRPVRADAGSTARPTTSAASSTAPTRSASASSSTSSTTTSGPDGNYLAQFSDRLLHRPLQERVGRGAQLRRRRRRAGARVLPRQRRLLDRRVPPRRPAPRRHAADLRRLAPTTSWRRSRGACARRPRGRATFVVAENEPQDVAAGAPAGRGRLRPRRAVERRLPPHRAWSR